MGFGRAGNGVDILEITKLKRRSTTLIRWIASLLTLLLAQSDHGFLALTLAAGAAGVSLPAPQDAASLRQSAAPAALDVSIGSPAAKATRATALGLKDALRRAYESNPQLIAQRASTRGIDENLQIAFGAFLPKVSGQASAGILSLNLLNQRADASAFGGRDGLDLKSHTNPVFAGATATLNIFNGFKGVNGINQAEAQIHQSRELLRASEINVLLAAVSSYMGVLADTAILRVRRNYAEVVAAQLGVAREKVKAGEISATDLSQVETYLALGEKNQMIANTTLQGSIAGFTRIVGVAPKSLAPAAPVDALLPKTLEAALLQGARDHPLLSAARYNVDINSYAVKMTESQLLPSVDLTASYGQNWNYFGTQGQRLYQGGGAVQLNVPLYDGGVSYGQIRQVKEKLGEAQALYDLQLSLVRQQIQTAWAEYKNAQGVLAKALQQVSAAEKALAGLRYELGFGVRTTFDVLNYQQILADARIGLVNAQKDRVLISYNLLASIGALTADMLALEGPRYDPRSHYDRVRLQMFGTNPR